MQPMLIVASEIPGLIYVNGRLIGEVEKERPQVLPVSPSGAVYLEHRPMGCSRLPLAQRIVFSGGEPLAGSLALAEGVEAVLWPGGLLEVELTPPEIAPTPPESSRSSNARCLRWGSCLLLERGQETIRCTLPEGACQPELCQCGALPCLKGRMQGGGEYAQVYSQDYARLLLSLTGESVRIEPDGGLEVLVDPQDLVGHARLETWRAEEEGCTLTRREPLWSRGAPAWPQSPQETALAALQAAQQGLMDEARGYLAPQSACEEALLHAQKSRGCVPLPRPVPSAEPCVGLLHLENERLLRVEPIRYAAEPLPGMQGPWRLTELRVS